MQARQSVQISAKVEKLIGKIKRDNSLKAWSLIITFFGDAIVSRGGNVSAKTVQTVLASHSIGSGAVRTAFSRLASDEWIVRSKIGRESFYALADDGYQTFSNAALRIYSPLNKNNVAPKDCWTVAIKNPLVKSGGELAGCGFQITSNCWLLSESEAGHYTDQAPDKNKYLLISGPLGDLPEWVTAKLLPADISTGYRQLQRDFGSVKNASQLSPLDCLVLRCLLVHQWRKLLLRTPVLPQDSIPVDWPEYACRELVTDLYHQLLPASEAWLDEHATCAQGSLPAPSVDLQLRFTSQFAVGK